MKTHHSRTQINEMRQVENCLLQAILICSTTGKLPSFEDKETCFCYQGQRASVEMEKSSGRLKVFQRGQANPFYDSNDMEGCVDLDYSWTLSYEVSTEIQRDICRTRRSQQEAARERRH